MTEPFDPVPDVTTDQLRALLRESERHETRRLQLGDRAVGIEGPLGDLLRAISAAHQGWLLASEFGATTDAESRRMEAITDAAVECEAWLRSGQ